METLKQTELGNDSFPLDACCEDFTGMDVEGVKQSTPNQLDLFKSSPADGAIEVFFCSTEVSRCDGVSGVNRIEVLMSSTLACVQ